MKIKQVNLYVVELPVADPVNGFTYGGGTFYKQDAVITEVICDNGLVGWGEHTTIGGVYEMYHRRKYSLPPGLHRVIPQHRDLSFQSSFLILLYYQCKFLCRYSCTLPGSSRSITQKHMFS